MLYNGTEIPESLSIAELECMLESNSMKEFCLAAKALVMKNSLEAYEVLKRHVYNPDIYKRRFILEIIFEYPYAVELKGEIEKALKSEDIKGFMVKTALSAIIKFNLEADDEILIDVLKRHKELDSWYYLVVANLENNEKNFDELLKLYLMRKHNASVRIALAEQLLRFANVENYMTLFNMFEHDEQPHIRIVACKIALKMNRKDLLITFLNDKDGHVRKYSRIYVRNV